MTDWPLAAAIMAGLVTCAAIYGIWAAKASAAEDARRRHEEFKMGLEPGHRETMAKIAATRDAEVAKYTSMNKTIEHKPAGGGRDYD